MRENLSALLASATKLRKDLDNLTKSIPTVVNLLPVGKSVHDLSLTELVKVCIALDHLISATLFPESTGS